MIVFSTVIGILAVAIPETTETGLRPAVTIELLASENRGQAEWKFNRDRSIAQLPIQTFAPLIKPRRITFPTQLPDRISPSLCHRSTDKQTHSQPLPILREEEVSQRRGEQDICSSTPVESERSIDREVTVTDNLPNSSREFNSIPNVQSQATGQQPAGASPSLEIQPSQPQQPPFQPQNLPVIPTGSLVSSRTELIAQISSRIYPEQKVVY